MFGTGILSLRKINSSQINISSIFYFFSQGEGQMHLAVKLDVTKKSEVESALAQVIKKYGRPANLIVNGAGILGVSFFG